MTMAGGRGWRLQQRTPHKRLGEGWGREPGHGPLVLVLVWLAFFSRSVLVFGHRCPIPLGLVGGPCSAGHRPGRPAHLQVVAGSLLPCHLHVRFHLLLLF